MFIKDEVCVNPFGVDINEFSVIIVSHPLDSRSLRKSDAKHVKKSSP
jgi:hypothetical protein